MSDILPPRFKPMQERCDAATDGPWEFTREDDYASIQPIIYDHKDNCDANDADYELMAHSRTDVPDLIRSLEMALGALEIYGCKDLENSPIGSLPFNMYHNGQTARDAIAIIERGRDAVSGG